MSTLLPMQSDAKIASERLRVLENLREQRDLTPEEERLVALHQDLIARWIAVGQRYLKALKGEK